MADTPLYLCHAIGCRERIPPKRLMCAPHWYLVPQDLKIEVWRTYRLGQEIDKAPSQAYLDAARNAINWVARIEQQQPIPSTAELIDRLQTLIANAKVGD